MAPGRDEELGSLNNPMETKRQANGVEQRINPVFGRYQPGNDEREEQRLDQVFPLENDRLLMKKFGLIFGSREFVSYTPKTASEEKMLRDKHHID